jgi:RNA polymerase sigma-70 factor (ECF subfamily)
MTMSRLIGKHPYDYNRKDLLKIIEEQGIRQINLHYTGFDGKLKELKSEYRNVLILKYVNDLSVSEIASILGKNKGNIRVTIYRALEALKNLTKDYEGKGSVDSIK